MSPLVWLVTGCSSGFGEAFVHSILARGDKVIATARNAETRLTPLKEKGASILNLDVTASQGEIDSIIKEAIGIYGRIDILINNAGTLKMRFLEEVTTEDWQQSLDTNFFGPVRVTTALLPHFRSRKAGKVAFTNSSFSWDYMETVGAYTVTKHALTGYAGTLALESAPFNIRVVSFDIGHFRTPIAANATFELPTIPDYAPAAEKRRQMRPLIHGYQRGDPEKGVKVMIDILTGEGEAKGKEWVNRVPIGSDSVRVFKDRCEGMLGVIGKWEGLVGSTDFPGPKQGLWALIEKQQAQGNAQVGGE